MAIPARQIGWSDKDNLLWNISKQLEMLTGVWSKVGVITTSTTSSTTSTSTTLLPSSFYYTANLLDCNNSCATLESAVLISSDVIVNLGSFYHDVVNATTWQILSLTFPGTVFADITTIALTPEYFSCETACGITTTTSTSTSSSTSTSTSTSTSSTSTTSTTAAPIDGCYGLLYNGYVLTNASPVYNTNAHIPTYTDVDSLINTFGGYSLAGGPLKQPGTVYWTSPNIGADNSSRFTALGSGYRENGAGTFAALNQQMYFWTTYGPYASIVIQNNTTSVGYAGNSVKAGQSIRLVIDTPNYIYPDGATGTYIGNDGTSYYCILIDGLWWMAENLRETKYQNGLLIPNVTNNGAWVALTTGAMCSYNNNPAYSTCVPSPPPPFVPTTTTTSSSTTTTTTTYNGTTTTTTTTLGTLSTLFIHIPNQI